MRALSTSEVRQKLRQKALHAEDIDPVISKLRDYGVLNDTQFAQNYAAARREREGFGKMRVLRDLRQRRVAPTLASEAVSRAFAGTDEIEMIEAYLKRKFRNVDLPEYLQEPNHLKSAYRKLRYAGFGVGPSIHVLKRYAAQADELEDSE